MKYLKIIGIVLLAIVIGLIVFIFSTTGEKTEYIASPEFEYSGLTNIKNEQYVKYREYILLKDGTEIAVTSLVPKNQSNTKFPAVLTYSPYTGSIVVPNMSWKDRISSKYYVGKWGPDYESMSLRKINTLTSHGYAVIFVDMRGTGSSTGHTGPFDPIIIQDSEEILAWIANQPWSDKKIGMIGQSYLGWSQFAAASTKSPYLKCIAPEMIFYNLYEEAVRPGGIYAQKWAQEYSEQTLEIMNRNMWNTLHDLPSYPSEPVIDEDNDGKLYDEIPILVENDLQPYSENMEYADGKQRAKSPYIYMTIEHEKNIWPREISDKLFFINDTLEYYDRKTTQSENSIDYLIHKLQETKIPVLLTGGFFDGFSRGIVQSFSNLKKTNPVYLFMLPRFHLPYGLTYEYWEIFNYSYNTHSDHFSTQLQFFDKYLKDKDNGFDKKKPAKIYTAFEGWKFYDSWPPENAKTVKFNLGQNNSLSKDMSGDGIYSYDVDFTHSSSYTKSKFNPQLMHRIADSIMLRNEHDKKCIVFETEILNEAVTVTGHPIINLQLSSNQANADVYVYLSDVDSTGVVYYVTEGKLRAGWHRLYDNNESVNNLYDVKPELPWHSYKKENYDPAPFANDSIVSLKFALKPHAWKFRKGHKIRISLAGADNENYEFNPFISPNNTLENCKPTTLNIHTGKKYESYLELPVID
ncbi:CocE/NonD family hydrolase [bacterium]|nr:CocE/NonD family hydrolase [bacterium]